MNRMDADGERMDVSPSECMEEGQGAHSSLFPSECGLWSIGSAEMEEVMASKPGDKFESEMFTANGLKWTIKLYPNGVNEGDAGNVDLGIYLVSISPNIGKLWVQYRMFLQETGTMREDTVGFARRGRGYLFVTSLKLDELQSLKLKTMNLSAEITMIDVYDDKGNAMKPADYGWMHSQSLHANRVKPTEYEWKPDALKIQKIKSAERGDVFFSDFFRLIPSEICSFFVLQTL